ncbi:YdcF family protein [Amorphus sp. MBR-141]
MKHFFLFCCILIGATLFFGEFLLSEYRERSHSTTNQLSPPHTAVVFTGQYDRIRFGLHLMETGAVDRLFISGVNRGAGLNPETFANQFHLSQRLQAAESAGRIVLAPDANTTLENAVETSCWLAQRPEIKEVALITSSCHMTRASLAFDRAVPGNVVVYRLDVPHPTGADARVCSRLDFWKFAATWVITLLPDRLWGTDVIRTCSPAGDRADASLAE